MRLRRAEEIETLSYRTVVELNAESRLAPQRRVATITRRPERAQRLASDRTGRADRRHIDREQRGDRRHADRTDRTSRSHQPEERGMVADARCPVSSDLARRHLVGLRRARLVETASSWLSH